ncbi:hypothetical protein BsIDN1_19070 [Bacillus safensis]|uniref:Uncharacterized protein n=1 Tax=Bacillus safensis TaxID=561879 RepID=A0A5S9M8L4_BACIA|nr:hypothetical protein BsIDN1_19070 [Bacillus safensis]
MSEQAAKKLEHDPSIAYVEEDHKAEAYAQTALMESLKSKLQLYTLKVIKVLMSK